MDPEPPGGASAATEDRRSEDAERSSGNGSATSPRLTGRHLLLLAVFSAFLATVLNLGTALHLTTEIPNSEANLRLYSRTGVPEVLGDPLSQAWEIAWDGYAIRHRSPGRFFEANDFWPLPHSLAFSDALLGYTPAAVIGSGARAALVRYNLLFLFSYALAFCGAYLLALELGARSSGAAVAGAAFAFNSFRLAQDGHLHVLSSGGIPLALWLLIRGWRNRRPGTVIVGWLVAAWQVSLGFTLGIPFAYLLAFLALGTAVAWRLRRGPPLGRGVLAASVVGMVLFAAWGFIQATPYVKVLHDYPEAKRTAAVAKNNSPSLLGYLSAPQESVAWGGITKGLRARLGRSEEKTIFPGATIIVLAFAGLIFSRHPIALRAGISGGVLLFALLAMGYGFANGHLYGFLWTHLPGWQASRTPGRLVTFALLGLALLGALGAGEVARRLPRERGWAMLRPAVGVALVALVLFEGVGRVPHVPVPPVPSALASATAPWFELPSDGAFDQLHIYWSTKGFPPIVNGESSVRPCLLRRLRSLVQRSFPDPGTIAILRSLGVNSVILDNDLARSIGWSAIASRPIEGLGISRVHVGAYTIFYLGHRAPVRPRIDTRHCGTVLGTP